LARISFWVEESGTSRSTGSPVSAGLAQVPAAINKETKE
jgi:hypothetical protein